ncbi:MAG: gst4 [Sphingomonas bacterium]|uniref:glutathione S-transferase family protein n=1 Tax=Sphingomonas bacterium TaxID=1895847 RepID=UPI002637E9B4|nr:glutathione S-transferase family protein [Sphingomonas bacterium]MDB5705114.1 gst4 [Sphingomonas bacterium]
MQLTMEDGLVSAFRWAPPFAQGLVRDMRVRWALREAGLPYEIDFVEFGEHKSPEFRARQPFGQIPTFRADGMELFESGAIVYAIGLKSEVLLPVDERQRLRTISWMFAALNTVEPPITLLTAADLVQQDADWDRLFRPKTVASIDERLSRLNEWLGERAYLVDRFTGADILMATVLRLIRHTDIVAGHPKVAAYLKRCEARPAFREALDEQMQGFAESTPVVPDQAEAVSA